MGWFTLLIFVIPFIKLIQDMIPAGYNVETTFQVKKIIFLTLGKYHILKQNRLIVKIFIHSLQLNNLFR